GGRDEAVRVAVRVRPMTANEAAVGAQSIVSVEGSSCIVVDPTAFSAANAVERESGQQLDVSTWARPFAFDHCYASVDPRDAEYAGQERIYADLGTRLLQQAWEGYNCSIFAYGQTGAGKSYCMMG
ncbi:unnamed protein product, partial [Phaeothamnion confervicola]